MARVECTGKTGVEMEAMTAVMVAGLNVVDMVKAVDRGCVLGGVRCVEKRGGRRGGWGVRGWEKWWETGVWAEGDGGVGKEGEWEDGEVYGVKKEKTDGAKGEKPE